MKGKRRLASALPEIYYGILYDIIGPDSVRIWEALQFWKDKPEFAQFDLGPNISHFALVYLAWKGRAPIITTNFDTLLEEAAKMLALTPVVSLPTSPELTYSSVQGFREAHGEDEVAIWKVHGSAEAGNLFSIQTTLRTIAAADRLKLRSIRHQFERNEATVCLTGYSGRDIDLFPYIASWPAPDRLYWLSPTFPRNHLIYKHPSRFRAVVGKSDALAERIIDHAGTADKRAEQLNRMLEVSGRRDPDGRAKEVYIQEIRRHIRSVFALLLPDNDPRRSLVHGLALASVGQNRLAREELTIFFKEIDSAAATRVEPRLRTRGLLLGGSLAHQFSKYEDSYRYCDSARAVADRYKLHALKATAAMASDEALRMQHLPRLSFHDSTQLLHLGAWFTIAKFVYHAFAYRNTNRRDGSGDTKEVDTTYFRLEYLEHLVRLGAIMEQGLVRIFGKLLSRVLIAPWWNWVERGSVQIGYAHGIANVRKYTERHGLVPKTTVVIEARTVFHLLSAGAGTAIAYRDQGDRLAERTQTAVTESERLALKREATRNYNRAYRLALVTGNASVALKVLIRRRQMEDNFRVERPKVEQLLNAIQGAGYRRLKKKLICWLSRVPD